MLEAAFWGLAGGAALLIGAVLGIVLPIRQRVVGYIMAFGAGVLVSAVAFDLAQEAFERSSGGVVAMGMLVGGVTFFAGDWLIDRRGGVDRKRSGGQQADGSATAIVLGALLDGIPESAAIGVSLLQGSGVGVAFVAAVFLSNMPESLSATIGLRRAGRSLVYVVGLWGAVMAASAMASVAGYALLGGASTQWIALIQTFAAGAILTMLADTMMPEAFGQAGAMVGLFTVLGFIAAFSLSTLE